MPPAALAEAIPVELRQTDDGWQLFRGGDPYLIRGAGGDGSLETLSAAGGNSTRTWSTEDIGPLLDEAHEHGISVTVGIWMGHERHGFDYQDEEMVAEQFEMARQAVLQYRDHPALLIWAVGNEMEGYESGSNPHVWEAVNDVAEMIKELDPNHPTMTVTADIGGGRIEWVHQRTPAIDIHGINTYGGAPSVAERLQEGGATKPFVLTEFGPVGTWEMPTTDWGAPYEQTSSGKADFYREAWENSVLGAPGMSLGAYAFLWSWKMEGTETWFGMFLDNGARTAAVDVMTELWSGSPPDDLAPAVEPLELSGGASVDPGTEISVAASATDPEGGSLRAEWMLRLESGDYLTGGDYRQPTPIIDGAIVDSDIGSATVRMPDEPGAYRLFYFVYDEAGNAATANVPLYVEGDLSAIRLPFWVYQDTFDRMPWAASGWMGSTEKMTMDGDHSDNPQEGNHSIRIRLEARAPWGAIAWQNPPNNWGDMDGGFDLTGATALEVWARGEYGGETIGIGVGLSGEDKAFPDTTIAKVDGIRLSRQWQRYTIPLEDMNLSSIKTGFVVSIEGRRRPTTIYLDTIRFIEE